MKHFYTIRLFATFPLLIIILLFFTSCPAGWGDAEPKTPPIYENGEGEIDDIGGGLSVGDEEDEAFSSSVYIPENAVEGSIYVKISHEPYIELPDEPDAELIQFQPVGYNFLLPVEIGLAYNHFGDPDIDSLVVVHYNPNNETITELPTTSINTQFKIIYAETDHFSYFAVSQRGFSYETFIDDRDNTHYKMIDIGNQTWMAENLKYETPSSKYYDNNNDYLDIYGRFYTFDEAKTACPSGWHLPSDNEWKTLETFIGMPESELNQEWQRGEGIGGKLKSLGTKYWITPNKDASNSYHFTALPGGLYEGYYQSMGETAVFWTSTEDSQGVSAWFRGLYNDISTIYRGSAQTDAGLFYSVRCIQN